MTQGDALVMPAYGMELLPLIRMLKKEFLIIWQPWYMDDAGARGISGPTAVLLEASGECMANILSPPRAS
jgi:hypothetical protein